jgi:hypothetical protein
MRRASGWFGSAHGQGSFVQIERNDDGTIEIAFAHHLGDGAVLKAVRMTSSTAC